MFLKKIGYSGRYRFNEIYSTLQKFLRRNELKYTLEMCKEFHHYPNT